MTDTEKDKIIVKTLGHSWLTLRITSLSTWEGFGWLWEEMDKREDWEIFVSCVLFEDEKLHDEMINPTPFRDAVYEWLVGRRKR